MKQIKTPINTIKQNIHGMNGKKVEIFANISDLIHAGNELIIQIKEVESLSDDMAEGIKLFQKLLEEIEVKSNEQS